MFIVILFFTGCWLPIKMYQLLLEFDILEFCTKSEYDGLIYLYIGCYWLATVNSCINPIIYAIMNNSFRVSIKRKMISNSGERERERERARKKNLLLLSLFNLINYLSICVMYIIYKE